MPLGQTHREIACRRCGAHHDDATEMRNAEERAEAGPGDYVLCVQCGALSTMPPEGTLVTQQPTADEYERFLDEPAAMQAMLVLRSMIAKRQ